MLSSRSRGCSMGKINMQKVLTGGLIAGVVLVAVDFVLYNIILKDQMTAAMTALNKPAMTTAQIPWFVVLDLISGVFLVWVYAAVRPRFGAGPGTAAKSAIALWFLSGVLGTLYMWPMSREVVGEQPNLPAAASQPDADVDQRVRWQLRAEPEERIGQWAADRRSALSGEQVQVDDAEGTGSQRRCRTTDAHPFVIDGG